MVEWYGCWIASLSLLINIKVTRAVIVSFWTVTHHHLKEWYEHDVQHADAVSLNNKICVVRTKQ